ncbi:hypothetical protein [Allokutzneria sp. NRRL B-24872]|nr:hypothetical protein [Allokutzneria sp. NRRL B-24872]
MTADFVVREGGGWRLVEPEELIRALRTGGPVGGFGATGVTASC